MGVPIAKVMHSPGPTNSTFPWIWARHYKRPRRSGELVYSSFSVLMFSPIPDRLV
jgi:hypothetical protein